MILTRKQETISKYIHKYIHTNIVHVYAYKHKYILYIHIYFHMCNVYRVYIYYILPHVQCLPCLTTLDWTLIWRKTDPLCIECPLSVPHIIMLIIVAVWFLVWPLLWQRPPRGCWWDQGREMPPAELKWKDTSFKVYKTSTLLLPLLLHPPPPPPRPPCWELL